MMTIKQYLPMKSDRRLKQKNQIMFKIILIGDSGTGKSCLMHRYVKNQFSSLYQTTIGTEFQSKVISVDQGYAARLQIWDTAGQQSFRSIIKSFFRNVGAVLLVYNITQQKTFRTMSEWQTLARESSPSNALFVLVGTHLDIQQKREVTRESAQKWMNENGVDFFFEASAKTDQNVSKVFEEIGKRLFVRHLQKRRLSMLQNQTELMRLKEEPQKRQKNCC